MHTIMVNSQLFSKMAVRTIKISLSLGINSVSFKFKIPIIVTKCHTFHLMLVLRIICDAPRLSGKALCMIPSHIPSNIYIH